MESLGGNEQRDANNGPLNARRDLCLRRKALCLSLSVSAFLPSRCPIKTCSYKAPFLTLSFPPSSQGAAPYLSGGFVAIIRCMQCPRVDKILHEKQRDDPGPASKKQPA